MAYLENGLSGASCPAGHTMGSGYNEHPECEFCGVACYALCGGMCSGVKRS